MAFIPKDAKWYLADIVQEIKIEGESKNVVHINMVLIRANSPEKAYDKAVALGKEGEHSYENTEGKRVTITFRGLRDLNGIHDKLEHGAELIFSEKIGLTNKQIEKMVCPRDQLGVFLPITPSKG